MWGLNHDRMAQFCTFFPQIQTHWNQLLSCIIFDTMSLLFYIQCYVIFYVFWHLFALTVHCQSWSSSIRAGVEPAKVKRCSPDATMTKPDINILIQCACAMRLFSFFQLKPVRHDLYLEVNQRLVRKLVSSFTSLLLFKKGIFYSLTLPWKQVKEMSMNQ